MEVKSRSVLPYLLIFCLISTVSTFVQAGEIAVLSPDSNKSGRIETLLIEDLEYLSLTQWARSVDADLEWDYVTGVAEMRFRDHTVRWVDTGRGAWVNGRMQSMPGPAKQLNGDFWIPIKLLDDLIDPLWEGDLTWNSAQRIMRRLVHRSMGQAEDGDLQPGDEIVIVLDAGHGGDDPGCFSMGGQKEKDTVLKILIRLKDILANRMGVRAIMTRPGDYNVSVDERVSESNRNRADLFLSLHVAPSEEMNGRSFMVYTQPAVDVSDRESELIPWEVKSEDVNKRSGKYARLFGDGMKQASTTGDYGVLSADLLVFRGLSMPSFAVELAWDSAFYGDLIIETDGGCNRAAEAIFDGIKSVFSQENNNGQ